jgi:hypothetical protein
MGLGFGLGFVRDIKSGAAAAEAARARQEGRSVFLYRFNVPAASSGFSGSVSGAAEVIEAIERAGWVLSQMAFDGHQSKNGVALLLFRSSQG